MADKTTPAQAGGAQARKVPVGGKSYVIGRYTVGDLAALQTELETLRERPVTGEEITGETATPRGTLFILWRCMRRHDGNLTLPDVHELFEGSDPSGYLKAMQAAGLTPEDGEAPVENPPKENQ